MAKRWVPMDMGSHFGNSAAIVLKFTEPPSSQSVAALAGMDIKAPPPPV